MNLSSPSTSPPSSLSRRTTSSVASTRTYSRRASAHKENRQAEARRGGGSGSSSSGSDDEIRVDVSRANAKAKAKGSPVSKARKNVKDDDEMLERLVVESPYASRSPSPSPPPAKRARTTSTAVLSRLQSRASSKSKQQPGLAPDVNVEPPSSSPSSSQLKAGPGPGPGPSTPPRRTKSLPGPITPTSSPRDLSALFAAVSPRRIPDSPGGSSNGDANSGAPGHRAAAGRAGGMRRMLSKTQSMTAVPTTPSRKDRESNEDSNSSPFGGAMSPSGPSTPSRLLGRTSSMPESPLKPSPRSEADSAPLQPNNQPGQTGSGGRAKRTYGKTRTMLAEVPIVSDVGAQGGTTADVDDDLGEQASYAELRQRYEVDNSTGLGEHGSGSGNLMNELLLARAPQTVSDMRSKGENRRFMDELGYLVDGISDISGSSLRRTSSTDILRNMLNETWLNKLKVCGQVEHVWQCFFTARMRDDTVMSPICLIFLAILLDSGSGLEQLVQMYPKDVVSLLIDHLRAREGLLDGAVSASDAKTAQKLGNLYGKLFCVRQSSRPSTRRLASSVLEGICRESAWTTIASQLDDERTLAKIIKAFQQEINLVSNRFDIYEKSLDLVSEDSVPDWDFMRDLRETVSTILLGSAERKSGFLENYKHFAQDLMNTAISGTVLILTEDDESTDSVQVVQLLAYLANESATWASNIVRTEGAVTCLARLILQRSRLGLDDQAEEEEEGQGSSLQTEVDLDFQPDEVKEETVDKQDMTTQEFLCLVLALLTTAALSNQDASAAINAINIDEGCVGLHACLRQCRCSTATPFARHLAQLYLEHLVQDDDPLATTLTGYLALLLSKLLVADSEKDNDMIMDALPGTQRTDKLSGLLSSLRGLNEMQAKWQKSISRLMPRSMGNEESSLESLVTDENGDGDGDVVQIAMRELTNLIAR